jgi:cytidyltransferase-like protein
VGVRVLAPGVWDCLHIGHVRHLEAAKALGDELIVSVTPSKFVNKGPGRPLFTDEERMDMVGSLRIVDSVYLEEEEHGIDIIEEVRPMIYACGHEYYKKIPPRVSTALNNCGGLVWHLMTRTHYSTTKIITGELLRERIDAFVESC